MMKRMTGAWLSSGGVLLAFVLIGWVLPGLVGLTGTMAWVLRSLLWALGTLAAIIILLYMRARTASFPEAAPGDEELETALATARKRLPAGTKLGRTPVILVLGARGSAKTTVVMRSGLEPDLLAGEVERGDQVAPTEVANLWLASGAVIAEAAQPLAETPARWSRFLSQLQPSRLAAVLARGRQAPRLALVCVSSEELVRPGGQDAVLRSAQDLRARLTDVARRFGVRLPVYVLFTKADQIPCFSEYVRSLSREEGREVLGATLPLAPPGDPGRYREVEAARVGAAFEAILRSTSLRRPDILARESTEEGRAGAYEFPRELRKASAAATRFLIEVCRPPQSGSAPFLRGFYFTGVRPVSVRDDRPAAPWVPSGVTAGATQVFSARAAMMATTSPLPHETGGRSRRIPEWTFLPRLFSEVVLADRAAIELTGGGARVDLLRRILLGAAAAAIVLAVGGFVVSFVANRGLVAEAEAAVASVQGVDLAGVGLAATEDLARLDTLREMASRLRTWETGRPPLRYRWGLYRGGSILEAVRPIYFHRFERMLWSMTRERIAAELGMLPDTPTAASDYTATFEALRAYMISTDHPEYSTSEAMTPVLMRYWTGGRQLEEERADLARSQFDFFASELRLGNPYDARPDPALVERTRRYLAMFGDTDRLYQALLNEASRQAPPVVFQDSVSGSESVLRAGLVVPGAFTATGWDFVQANVGNVDRFFSSDAWVLGDQTVSAADRARMAVELEDRYERDYVRTWTEFLSSASVPRYQSAQDAAVALQRLSDPRSPLLRLLAIAARNTAVDTVVVRRAFQPLHAVIPPDSTERFIQPSNEGYVNALSNLAQSMSRAAGSAGPAREAALQQAQGDADRARGAVRQIAQGFGIDGDAAVGTAVQRLLEEPVVRLQPLLAALPAEETNAKGTAFCSTVAPLLRKYPFTQNATAEASIDEVNAAFQPGGSALSTLLDGLQDVIVRQGSGYRPRPGAPRQPTEGFLRMLNQAVRISEALYPTGAPVPTVEFAVQPIPTEAIPQIVVSLDGRNHTVTRTDFQLRRFDWNAGTAREAQISARVGVEPARPLVTYAGTWSTFRLFGQASWSEVAAGRYRLSWNVNPGGTLTAELVFPGRTPIFNPEVIAGMSGCVPTVVR